jgi:hypothetical protein
MTKKLLYIGIGAVLAIAILGVAGFAYAATQTSNEGYFNLGSQMFAMWHQDDDDEGYIPGEMPSNWYHGGRGGYGHGMFGEDFEGFVPEMLEHMPGNFGGPMMFNGGFDLMENYMLHAMAEALNMLPEELLGKLESGESLVEIAEAEGLSEEEFSDRLYDAVLITLNQAVNDGVITEEQAQQFTEMAEHIVEFGFGFFRVAGTKGIGFGSHGQIRPHDGNRAIPSNEGRLDEGPLHEYMHPAIAEAFTITPEELEERHETGESLWDIVEEQGLSEEEFKDKLLEAVNNALDKALEDGVISEEQVEHFKEMAEHMGEYRGFGFRMMPGFDANSFGPGKGIRPFKAPFEECLMHDLMGSAFTDAIEQAVENGTISPEQAEWILDRHQEWMESGE